MTAYSRDVRARLRVLFLDELDDHVERLGRGIEALAAAGADSKAQVVQDLFRSAHSLKGAAQATETTEVALVCQPEAAKPPSRLASPAVSRIRTSPRRNSSRSG